MLKQARAIFAPAFILLTSILVNGLTSPLPCWAQYNQQTQYGMNIEAPDYGSADAMYVDAFVHASGWWGGTNGPLTPEGYPASGSANTLFYMDGYPPSSKAGPYNFYGKGDFSISMGNAIVPGSVKKDGDVTTAQINIEVTPPNPGTYYSFNSSEQILSVTVNDPNNPPHDFHLIRPDYPAWPNTQTEFGKEYTGSLAPFQVFRFMDFENTNWTTVTTWASRPQPDVYGAGNRNVAFERAIELCNATHSDPWFNIPVSATDDYIINLGRLCAARLNPDLHVYVEFSNECWNWGFPQWQIVQNWANNDPDITPGIGAWAANGEEVAKQCVRCGDLMRQSLGSRVRPVLAGQLAGVSYTAAAGLNWIKNHYGDPRTKIFAISGAAYFAQSSAHPNPSNLDDLFTSMSENIDEIDVQVKQYTSLARQYNVQFVCYESGQSLYAFSPDIFPLYQSAQYDPRMAALYQKLANMLQSNGTYLCCFCNFAGGHDSRYGFWNALTDIALFNMGGSVKYNAQAAIAAAGGLTDAKQPPPASSPPGGGSSGGNSPGRSGKMHTGKPVKWMVSPGMGRKMAQPPPMNKHFSGK